MAKIFFIVPPLTGHINPTVSVGQTLIQNGHEVAWVGHESILRRSLPLHCRILSLLEESQGQRDESAREHGDRERRGFAGLYYLWESVLLPLARESISSVESIISAEAPDLCIVDQQMLSGAIVCQRLAVPYLTSATTSAALIDALEGLPQVSEWHNRLLDNLWQEYGLQIDVQYRLDLSPLGTLAFSSKNLTCSLNPNQSLPENIYFVGPALEGKRANIDFPWNKLDQSLPRLFLSMGTVNAYRAKSLYQQVVRGLSDMPLQLIAAAPPEYFTAAPKHWIIQSRVPQLEVLSYMNAVLCHGGHNTTMEALAYGLPLIIAPIRDDQPVIAEQIRAVGAGIRIHFSRSKAPKIAQAVTQILCQAEFKKAAQQVRIDLLDLGSESQSLDPTRPLQLPKRMGAHRATDVIEHILYDDQNSP